VVEWGSYFRWGLSHAKETAMAYQEYGRAEVESRIRWYSAMALQNPGQEKVRALKELIAKLEQHLYEMN
jgi:hypothetical protein